MKILLLLLAKRITIFFNWLGRIKPDCKYDALIVGNYDHKSLCQKLLLEKLDSENLTNLFLYNIEKKNSFEKMLAYAKCAYLMAKARNIIVFDFCFPLYCIKKLPEQKAFQLWHANGPFKRFGLPNFREKHGVKMAEKMYGVVPIHSTYDYIFVSSDKCIPHYMTAFNDFDERKYLISNNIFLDMLIEQNKSFKRIRNDKEINVIMAPTFNYSIQEDIYQKFTDCLKSEAEKRGIKANVVPLLHPKLAANYDKIDVMLNADILVTDYSTVCFEASAIGRKVAFLRNNVKTELFVEVAKKVYQDPGELALDILEDKLIDNELNDYICPNENKQLDMVVSLIKDNHITHRPKKSVVSANSTALDN